VDVVVHAQGLTRRFEETLALNDTTLMLGRGETRALLGPNGAGKTTLLRLLAGLIDPTSGTISVLGQDTSEDAGRSVRERVGFIPSGDRTFYLRISGLENLIFFARLHGMNRKLARERAVKLIEEVGLTDAATRRVGLYSHGMVKRLSVARALLAEPEVLFVDEATHDLDPEASAAVRGLISGAAGSGTAVLWATQRLEEIRDYADSVTVLSKGSVIFDGSVASFLTTAPVHRYLVRLRTGDSTSEPMLEGIATLESVPADPEHYVLSLIDEAALGTALSALLAAGYEVLACREAGSQVEDAFLQIVAGAN
jgi:ABC-2 type transport system ATP-binding protein